MIVWYNMLATISIEVATVTLVEHTAALMCEARLAFCPRFAVLSVIFDTTSDICCSNQAIEC